LPNLRMAVCHEDLPSHWCDFHQTAWRCAGLKGTFPVKERQVR
jgi:hypothetical protein